MTRFASLFSTPSRAIPNLFPYLFLLLSWLGFLDSAYLAIEHYRGVIPSCSVIAGCEKVLTSPYSEFFGIPVALFGVLFYLAVLFLTVGYFVSKNAKLFLCASFVPFFGLAGTLWFLYAQAFLLGAFCLYCLASAAITFALAILSLLFFRKILYTRKEHTQ
ncbi:MAG: vitamin K epoxide reductase family protein [Candidatus Wildermuthbacteria bacterium]|nr:vitamin K epoxide reductase family protein [Candidatus Wildermuthbacteria bacterium]